MSNPLCIQNIFNFNSNKEFFIFYQYLLNRYKSFNLKNLRLEITPFYNTPYSSGNTIEIYDSEVYYFGNLYVTGDGSGTNQLQLFINDSTGDNINIVVAKNITSTKFDDFISVKNVFFNYVVISYYDIFCFSGYKINIFYD